MIISNNGLNNHENVKSRLAGILGGVGLYLGSHAEASNILQRNLASKIWEGRTYINLIISNQFIAINNFQ